MFQKKKNHTTSKCFNVSENKFNNLNNVSEEKLDNFKMLQPLLLLMPMVNCDVFSVDQTTNRIVNYMMDRLFDKVLLFNWNETINKFTWWWRCFFSWPTWWWRWWPIGLLTALVANESSMEQMWLVSRLLFTFLK